MNKSFAQVSQLIKSNSFEGRIHIPSNWQLSGIKEYSGSIWFIKQFKINLDNNNYHLSIIKFLGIDYFADIWLNDKYVGHHEGYFQKFLFDISDAVKQNERNLLVVKVTSPREEPGKVWPNKKKLIKGIFNHHDCRPGGWNLKNGQDQNTGGIWNNVELFFTKSSFLTDVKIQPAVNLKNKTSKLSVKLFILSKNKISKTNIKLEVTSPKGTRKIYNYKTNLKKGKNIIEIALILKDIILWWTWDVGKPNLYKMKISSMEFNGAQQNFGLRIVELDKRSNFYINGKKLFLRGTNLIPALFLSELKTNRIKKIVKLIKDANINIIRMHAHVNRQELYDELDKQGILVWQDFSLQWTYEDTVKFEKNAVRQIRDMVSQLYNHPSIAFWCCHNEPGEQVETLDKKLLSAVKSIDKLRIIRIASNYEEHAYDGWYWGKTGDFIAAPMGPLVTEFGAQALPDKNSLLKFIPKEKLFLPDIDVWEYHNFQFDQTFNIAKIPLGKNINEFIRNSQNYQSELLKKAIHSYRRKKGDGITGIFQFMFIDYWPSITWSVVDYYLNPKLGYDTLKEAFKPLLLSVNLKQDQYFPGSKLNVEFWIINDRNKEYKKLSVMVLFDNKVLVQINNININKDIKIHYSFESLSIRLPLKIKSGKHNLTFELLDSKRNKVSLESCQINIVQKNIEEFFEN